ncbi:MAG: autotransporter outer membrane beta-barrel domain-containing protein [Treponema sp.]|jgi:hypothetical protein|nr:autotransporter outer membrane beta-barrel domain-containing protein [Treponema sp.]
MMRKNRLLPAALLAALPLGAVFGVDISLSAGGGGFLGGLFTRYTLTADGNMGVPVKVLSAQGVNQFNYGGYFFWDVVFAELSVGFHRGENTWTETISAVSSDAGAGKVFGSDTAGTGTEVMLNFALLGKYPFPLGKRLTLFPLAGIEYQLALLEYRKQRGYTMYDRTDGIRETGSNGGAYGLSAWNSLFINVGAGIDVSLIARMYLRTELLYGFRLMTPYEADALEKVKKQANAPNPKLAGLTSGPTLRIGVGYRPW